jgi:hypothetical protein
MTRTCRWLGTFVAVGITCVGTARAQVTTLSPLEFGTIVSGTTTSVAPTSPDAAAWRIHGSIGVAGVITLSLPSTLARSGGGGSLPVSFCTSCGVYRINNSNPAGGSTFNPNSVLILTIVLASDLYIWIGGSANPPLNQPAGSYSGTIVITVVPLL